MSNPLLSITDLRALAALCRKRGLKLVVDNTFTPLMVRPLEHGADVVIHSCTKYISGGSDLIAGAICGSQAFINELIDVNTGSVMLRGPVMDPRVAHELYLRLDHLPLRMAGHSRAALHFSRRCEESGVPVIYPGLTSHRHHERLKEMMGSSAASVGFGGMVTLPCGTAQQALELAAKLQEAKFGLYAVSLGFSRTLMTCPALSTSSEIPEADQARMGLTPGLMRLSIGYTGDDQAMFERFLKCWQSVKAK